MKSLHDLVYEKLILNKSISKENKPITLDDVDPKSVEKISRIISDRDSGDMYLHRTKMEGYQKKGSKPARLIATIKNTYKLVKRWYAAVEMQWDEAIQEFGQAIEDRGICKLVELHNYILYKYNRNPHQTFEHYLKEVYNIKY